MSTSGSYRCASRELDKPQSLLLRTLGRLLRFLVEPRKKVLSVRCGTGFHLAAFAEKGKGIDLCGEIVEIARQQNPSFEFAVAFPDKEEFRELFESDEKFDYILFSNIGDTVDALQALRNLARFACGIRGC